MQIMKNRISYIDIAQGSGGYMQHNIPMWFVPCLFIVENIGFFISKIKKNYLRIVVTVFLGILGCIITTTENNIFNFKELFWSIEIALVAIPFYIFGIEVTNKISNNFAFFKNFDCRKFGNI